MGFSFGFDEEGDVAADSQNGAGTQQGPNGLTLDQDLPSCESLQIRSPSVHSLEEIVRTFSGIRISYERVATNVAGTELYRRQLHDVQYQLMVEDSLDADAAAAASTSADSEDVRAEMDILMGACDSDLANGVYEGGLKSWECSYDCIEYLSRLSRFDALLQSRGRFSYLEIGCGTALPSMYVLQRIIEQGAQNVSLVLTDYNYHVLRLVTIPNLFITWYVAAGQGGHDSRDDRSANEILMTGELIDEFLQYLAANAIELSFVSGGWCAEWLALVEPRVAQMPDRLYVTSETIYSIPNQPVLAQVVRKLAQADCTGIIAGKEIYFGVGGTMQDFLGLLDPRHVIQRERLAGGRAIVLYGA